LAKAWKFPLNSILGNSYLTATLLYLLRI
jgi:hypothetical protein